MDIDGLGGKILEQVISAGLVRNAADLYRLNSVDLLQLEGFKAKKTENILKGIEASKEQSLSRFLFALGQEETVSSDSIYSDVSFDPSLPMTGTSQTPPPH